ncbi:IclR family transcriptional regulator [Gracilibacillus alcaliphilus]|uniref:IclR family transcriptional regulator n=1 Tax=Gracilibacillus alcaliphilus TaxID=1401441 RepID=UPI0019568F79|nr:IclR family transcriptional regulator [Gracilibacillus alcaliphilus]MBM7677628.1 DNA-binding IclR family transcriptional regulator [Gracilibacillus alcaliphilus]
MPIIQSVDRALKILDLFNEQNSEMKITEISRKLDLNKSTAHSLLKTLKMHNYIKQDPDSGKYSLGLKLLERGQFMLNSMDIREIARKYLIDLSVTTGQTTHLVILEGLYGVYIDKVEGESAVVYSRIGKRVPIHSSAVGKSLVAFRPQEEIEELLQNYAFFEQTDNTIIDKQVYVEELAKVRTQGYSIDNEENEPGIYCIAVPIFDHANKVVAAISISTTKQTVTPTLKQEIINTLKQTSSAISKVLGNEKIYL